MPTELPKQYEPQTAQARWYPFWEQHGWFNADPNRPSGRTRFD